MVAGPERTGMTAGRKERASDREKRLREAVGAAETVQNQGRTVGNQLSLVGRLTDGWKRVHRMNHLAQLFTDEGRLG
jgi:hypothetical protein